MEFLMVFGLIMMFSILPIKNRLLWEVDPDSCNIEYQKRAVKLNKIFYYGGVFGGFLLFLIGLIGTLI